jgi:hypothetical protein
VALAVSDDLAGCRAQLPPNAIDDIYAALVSDDVGRRAAAAQIVLTHRSNHARAVVQRAIEAVASAPVCSHLRALTDTLEDPALDEATRAAAALALGIIARDFPCLFPEGGSCPKPHDPIPAWSQRALRDCAGRKPTNVARACVEALGYVSGTDTDYLRALRDDPGKDAMLRVFAGRALTRLTKTRQVTRASLDKLITDAEGAQ